MTLFSIILRERLKHDKQTFAGNLLSLKSCLVLVFCWITRPTNSSVWDFCWCCFTSINRRSCPNGRDEAFTPYLEPYWEQVASGLLRFSPLFFFEVALFSYFSKTKLSLAYCDSQLCAILFSHGLQMYLPFM